MATVARIAFRVPRGAGDAFAELFDRRLASLLRRHGLDGTAAAGRPARPGVFSRHYGAASPEALRLASVALGEDPSWQRELAEVWRRIGQTDPLEAGWRLRCLQRSAPMQAGPAGPGASYGIWRHFRRRDGLGVAAASAIAQDHDGALWFGGTGRCLALCRFDGAEFATLEPVDCWCTGECHALLADPQGGVWAATDFGLARYDGERLTCYGWEDGLLPGPVWALMFDRNGALWAGGEAGVCCWSATDASVSADLSGLPALGVHALAEGADGTVWLGTDRGLWRWVAGRAERCDVAGAPGDVAVLAIVRDAAGSTWASRGSGQGLCRLDGEQAQVYGDELNLPWPSVTSLAASPSGLLWAGAVTGVACFDGHRFRAFTVNDGLPHNQVEALCVDRDEALWVAAQTAGVCRGEGRRLVPYLPADGLPSSLVFAAIEEARGDLWLATVGGTACWRAGRLLPDEYAAQAAAAWLLAGTAGRDGTVWFRSQDGILQRSPTGYRAWRDGRLLAGRAPVDIIESSDGSIWFTSGYAGLGLARWRAGQIEHFRNDDGLPDDRVFSVAEDANGTLWAGTGMGLARLDGERFAALGSSHGLPTGQIMSLCPARDGGLWLGLEGLLARFDGNRTRIYTAADGVPAQALVDIYEDRDGHLWVSSWGEGLARFDGHVFQTLDRSDGLPSDAVQSVRQARDGSLWIATEGGVVRYLPARRAPVVRIVDVATDGGHVAAGERVAVPASSGFVRIGLRGSSLATATQRMVYVYGLTGRDQTWQQTRDPWAEYTHLPVGEYRFEVRAVDRDLNWSQPATLTVAVEPDLHREALYRELSTSESGTELVGRSAALRSVQATLAKAALSELHVLITGETGTGKGVAARALHALSRRAGGPFVQVSCGAMPEGLVESELFGHEKGAFTGAVSRKLGKVELAEGGTLFLDEIGDMPLSTQTKVLRLLDDGTFERVGGSTTQRSRARVVAATNRDLGTMVEQQSFRADLYYRLSAFPVEVPPLRERPEDIPLLACYFMDRMAAHLNKDIRSIAAPALTQLQRYTWPGNVRELEHAVQRAVIVCNSPVLGPEHFALAMPAGAEAMAAVRLEDAERRHILAILQRTEGRIKGPGGAAELLGLPPSTLRSRMARLGISAPGRPGSASGSARQTPGA